MVVFDKFKLEFSVHLEAKSLLLPYMEVKVCTRGYGYVICAFYLIIVPV